MLEGAHIKDKSCEASALLGGLLDPSVNHVSSLSCSENRRALVCGSELVWMKML